MKTTSPLGKEILGALSTAVPGEPIKGLHLPSLLPAIQVAVQAIPLKVEPKFWEIGLYWLGIHVQDVVVEIQGDDLRLDTL